MRGFNMASKNLIEQSQPSIQPSFGFVVAEVSKEQERKNADEAVLDFRATGQTLRHCLRCGGDFNFFDGGSSFSIICQTEGCFEETLRGI